MPYKGLNKILSKISLTPYFCIYFVIHNSILWKNLVKSWCPYIGQSPSGEKIIYFRRDDFNDIFVVGDTFG